jgi:hypothetical protein
MISIYTYILKGTVLKRKMAAETETTPSLMTLHNYRCTTIACSCWRLRSGGRMVSEAERIRGSRRKREGNVGY